MTAPSIRLDRSRPVAEVHGEVEHGLTFIQDGLPFSNQGELIEALLTTDEQRETVEKKLRRLKKLAEAQQEPQPQSTSTAGNDDDEDDEEGGDDDTETSNDYNFEAWLRDEVRYIPGKLFKAARERFNRQFSTFADLAEFLVHDQKLMPAEQVPTKLKRAD